ncbi:hypothetical protein [Novosphingobium resinovorum]|uniref:aromatic-ring hydroxylase C-terminal domain-containing protein n=1 Tax=Novosphingobium resinovorum TaxID=158500 RepID=UPI002ED1C230|nr:hypothetical protein [Novosphingobium resinovorum]
MASNGREPSGLQALFVRADGFVAWASDRPSDGADVARSLSQWLGIADRVDGPQPR